MWTTVVPRTKSGYLLERLSIPRYTECFKPRENASGADNQQERPSRQRPGILRDHTPDLRSLQDDMVRPPWRHGEPGGNVLAAGANHCIGSNKVNGPKVNDRAALVKLNHMRETPRTAARYSSRLNAAVKIRLTWGQSAGKTPGEENGEPSET
jgi:hypothetical protein